MGRWAQQDRRGGGGPRVAGTGFIQMIDAEVPAGHNIQVNITYDGAHPSVILFDPSGWTSGAATGVNLVSTGFNKVRLDMDAFIDAGDILTYEEFPPAGVRTPQSIKTT